MTRASFAGGQRYAVTWTGDNSSSWDHLKLAVQQMLSLGLSGFAWSGADIPGFTGGASADLATRWFEIGAFTPVFRGHSAKDTPRAEPWVDGPAHLAIRRRFIDERYRLLPYLYAVADESARTGDPFMRPTFYDYPQMQSASCDQSMAFTVGARLARGRIAQAGLARTLRHLPASQRLVRLLDRARGSRPPRPARLRVSTTCRSSSGPARSCRASRWCRARPRRRRGRFSSTSIRARIAAASSTSTMVSASGAHVFGRRSPARQHRAACRFNSAPREGSFRPWWKQIAITVHGSHPAHRVIADQPAATTVQITDR